MIKLKELNLENFGEFSQLSVSFDDNVTYLVGPNGTGKSTAGIIGLQFVMQGIAEKSSGGNMPIIGERFRFIGENGKDAKGSIVLHDSKMDCDIIVRRTITPSGNELSFEAPVGIHLDQKWLNDLFDIFMISPKYFESLSSKEQTLALGIDLSEHDKKIKELKENKTLLGRELKALGSPVSVKKVEKVDVTSLWEEIRQIKTFNDEQEKKQKVIDSIKDQILSKREKKKELEEQITLLQQKLTMADQEEKSLIEQGKSLPKPEPVKDTDAIEQKIDNANGINEQAVMYEEYVKTTEKIKAKQKEIDDNLNAQSKAEQKRLEVIKEMKLPFANMIIDDEGKLLLEGRPIKSPYFSTGQLIRIITSLMVHRNPEFRYVYIQDWNLLDADNQKKTLETLQHAGLQVCIEYVGESLKADGNIIIIKDAIDIK